MNTNNSLNHINNLVIEKNIEWSFGDKNIQTLHFPVQNSNKVLVNIHGTFWSLLWWNDKYKNFAESVQNKRFAHSVLFESSRISKTIDPNITDRYERKQAKFVTEEWERKTFSEELDDARLVLKDIIENSQKQFWIDSQDLEIILNGNSLGWILAFYLANEFPQVVAISSVWTGLRLEAKDVPILDTFPEESEIKSKLSTFQWDFIMNQWSLDDVFDKQAFAEYKESILSGFISHYLMIWVDHSFWKTYNKTSKKPYQKVFEHLMDVLKKWNYSSKMFIVADYHSDLEDEINESKEKTKKIMA